MALNAGAFFRTTLTTATFLPFSLPHIPSPPPSYTLPVPALSLPVARTFAPVFFILNIATLFSLSFWQF